MINQKDKDKIRASALAEITRLKDSIASLKTTIAPISPDCSIGRLTRLEAMNTKSINEANLRTAQEKILSLEQAMDQLQFEDYGLCATCEEPIPLGRLLLLPFASACVKCLEAGEDD